MLQYQKQGGEKLTKEKLPKMTFVATGEVPKRKGREGTNWSNVLSQIPEGMTWKLPEDNKDYKLSTVKQGVKEYNKSVEGTNKPQYEAVQRTIEGKKYLYITQLAPEPEAIEATEEEKQEE